MQEYVNRPNYEGPFAIHLSADMKSTLLLMKVGAKQYRNKEGDQILQKQSGPAPHLLRLSHSTALTSQNKQDQSLLSELKPDLFKKVALRKKQKTLNLIHLISEESVSRLIQQTEDGDWQGAISCATAQPPVAASAGGLTLAGSPSIRAFVAKLILSQFTRFWMYHFQPQHTRFCRDISFVALLGVSFSAIHGDEWLFHDYDTSAGMATLAQGWQR